MCWKSILMTSILVIVTSQITTQTVILPSDFFSYLAEDSGIPEATSERVRTLRTLGESAISCPSDMTEYECYHTFMAVWTRVLQKDKRLTVTDQGREILQRLYG